MDEKENVEQRFAQQAEWIRIVNVPQFVRCKYNNWWDCKKLNKRKPHKYLENIELCPHFGPRT